MGSAALKNECKEWLEVKLSFVLKIVTGLGLTRGLHL